MSSCALAPVTPCRRTRRPPRCALRAAALGLLDARASGEAARFAAPTRTARSAAGPHGAPLVLKGARRQMDRHMSAGSREADVSVRLFFVRRHGPERAGASSSTPASTTRRTSSFLGGDKDRQGGRHDHRTMVAHALNSIPPNPPRSRRCRRAGGQSTRDPRSRLTTRWS